MDISNLINDGAPNDSSLKEKNDLEREIMKYEQEIEKYKSRIADLEIKNKAFVSDKNKFEEEKKNHRREKDEFERLKTKKEKELLVKDEELLKREINADEGFVKQHQESLKNLRTTKENLEKQINDFEKLKSNKLVLIDKEIEKYREDEEAKVEKHIIKKKEDLENYILKRQSEFEEETQTKMRTLERLRNELNNAKEENLIKESDYEKRIVDLERLKRKFEIEVKLFEEDKRNLGFKLIEKEKEIKERISNENNENDNYLEELKKIIIEKDKQIREYEKSELYAGGLSKKEIVEEREFYKNEYLKIREKLSSIPREDIMLELEEKAKRYDDLLKEKEIILKEKIELEQSEHKWMMSVSQLEIETQKREYAEKRREVIEAQMEKYYEELNRLKNLYEQPKEIEARIGVIEEPFFEYKETMVEDQNEMEWLQNIYQKCEDSGMKFNKRLLYSFHASMKTAEWSPLTVLAGVSGTGKSELPRLYTRFGGIYYLPLPVQPDWDSPQSLFGFFNSVDNRFNATNLLRTLVQFSKDTKVSLKDYMLLVLLDEMNLAHVELYFSELLSKLETRRGEKKVDIDIDLGAGLKKYQVDLTRNTLWVGTMNEDETTKTLSDKVIDRGNIINFPRPIRFERRLKLELASPSMALKKSTWNSWINNKITFDDKINKYKECLEEINQYLEVVGRAIGHRVWQSIENYMSNHPLVIAHENSDAFKQVLEMAFEEALVFKVMPKLRGIETSGNSKTNCLSKIEHKISELAPGLVEDFKLAMQSEYGSFLWRSAKYLENEFEE